MKKTREEKKCHQYPDHFNINKSGRFFLLSFFLWIHIVNFLKYASPGGDILPEELDTPSTYAHILIRANFHIKWWWLALVSRRRREEEEDTKGRLDAIEENCLNINEKRKEKKI
jgi:hypothetical protein